MSYVVDPAHPQPPAPQYLPPQPPKASNGLAIAALVVGIVAFLLGLVPVVGAIIGIVGVVLGVTALAKKQPKGLALTGTILASIAIVASILATAGVGAAVDTVSKEVAKSETAEPRDTKSLTPSESQPEQNSEPEQKSEPKPEAKSAPQERLTLDEGWTAVPDQYGFSTVVNGYVSNNSDKAVTNYVQITFDTYDAAGANLGTCLANANTIDANGKWKFEAHCLSGNGEIAEVKFKEISSF